MNSTDTDLKSSVIEFMRARPFLWNKRHPGYKDHKKREIEFQKFSSKTGHSVQEIKRVWHVLRTNFFRAHKIQTGKEKPWKYYASMLYILEGNIATNNNDTTGRRVSTTSSAIRDTDGLTNGMIADISSANLSNSKLSTFNESLLDEDDDFLYAKSLSLTLRKFDPTTKEVVKLKFQEIIVEYMQQRQRHQQLQQKQQQELQLEPPPPSEIANNMETSLVSRKQTSPTR